MRRFELIDGSRRVANVCAILMWEQADNVLVIEVCDGVGQNDLPMTLGALVAKGMTRIDGEWAVRWVGERVPPPGRQNLGEILKANGLEFYDEYDLFFAGDGRCAQDDFYIREVPTPSESLERDEAFACVSKVVAAGFRKARKEAGLTQSELAKKAGLRQAAVSRFESGKSNPTIDMLASVAHALGKELEITLR